MDQPGKYKGVGWMTHREQVGTEAKVKHRTRVVLKVGRHLQRATPTFSEAAGHPHKQHPSHPVWGHWAPELSGHTLQALSPDFVAILFTLPICYLLLGVTFQRMWGPSFIAFGPVFSSDYHPYPTQLLSSAVGPEPPSFITVLLDQTSPPQRCLSGLKVKKNREASIGRASAVLLALLYPRGRSYRGGC